MNTAVIYKSHYGSTEIYAKWLAKDLDADLLQAEQVKPADLQKYQTIVYGGGLYAGGVNGIALLTKNFELIKDKALYLFTVGAADVTDPENLKNIRSALEQKLPPAMREKLHIYHLRGGMRYSKMNFMHRTMMNMMVKMLRKKAENELRAEDKIMLETYGQDIDFTDRAAIVPLVADIRAGAKSQ
ncbi:hypothetical protein acsn021_41180 [Anaerocolumna cellulosilytica]|uniref:Uncharacterized protein n=1 Tax=Anaerocolumna cellulosilytica TaxID=433286 RepID=A0A6S6R5C9_9FIRM|nr:flavodoxin domain-containing protein [Anaerocolumna cellulosilytica]MBB5197524.1 menaquinone-dependent protoporphyrinogen IX oxidase [Anaerocolumna cellulosilytica]BCJ96549.1 hypothetical protein acsn021_41180 [Anaerocolumna cellulosilytica]